jgi:hypothetical protein
MDPGRAAGDGDIEAIVHQHARRAAVRERHDLLDEVHERSGFQVPFADLQIVNAGLDGMPCLLEDASPGGASVS